MPSAQPVSILFLFADQMHAFALGCMGNSDVHTPNLDALAARGVLFRNTYSSAPLCTPMRANLFTGRYCCQTGTLGNEARIPAGERTLADALNDSGYRTGYVGKWHLGGKGSLPQDHGFEVVFGLEMGPGRGPDDDPHFAAALSQRAAEFIEQARQQPFFLYLPLHSVHVPLKTRPALLAKYQAKAAALPASSGPREVPVGDHKARAVQDLPVYAGMVQEMDEAVDRVLQKLDALKLSERTVVIFTSDNGGLCTAEGSPTANLPLRAGKGWNYEGGIRVPLMVRLPGRVPAGSFCDVPVISNDLYPTLVALAGVPMPAGHQVDGVSLLPLLERKGGIAERPLFWHYPHYSNQGGRPSGAMRLGSDKLLERFEDNGLELYDLAADEGERRDLAAPQSERAGQMKKLLADWRQTVGAQMPTPNPEPVDPFGPNAVPRKARPAKKRAP